MILWRGGAAQNGAGIGVERTSIAHPASPTPFYGSTYSYDAVGRLGSVTNDRSGDAFTYGYQDQSFGLVRSVTGPVHTVTNDWEAHRNILDKKTNGPVTAPISSYHYTVNGLGQRTNLATDGSAFSVQPALTWTYNARGELVETADASASDFDRAYQYDGIGNREKTAEGLLADLPASANYQADALNQYSSVTLGSTALSPVHDLDGNATSYPLPADGSANSTLVWDGENRLVSATTPNNVVTTFIYDYLSRRISKATTTGATTSTECYLYDGWNPVVEKRAPTGSSFDEIRLYTWGIDLSGSSQGAGGVAGLLAIEKQGNIFSSSPTTDHYYPTYDGNGNVSEYLDSAGLVVAHFEYDPFGNTTVNTDTAGLFDILFSTKKKDLATGLYYYGYRYYDPVTGRWPSRDPIGEWGGANLYGMVRNDVVGSFDVLGLLNHKDSVKWLEENLAKLKKCSKCCKNIKAVLSTIYVELRRQGKKDTLQNKTGWQMYVNYKFKGNSYGPAQMKPSFVEELIKRRPDDFKDFKGLASGSKKFRQKVWNKIQYEAICTVSFALEEFTEEWDKAREKDPTVKDISDEPGILATLYNLGFAASKPKPNPKEGGSKLDIDGNKSTFGGHASKFATSTDMESLLKKIGCDGKNNTPQ